jgi:hypothetical protein
MSELAARDGAQETIARRILSYEIAEPHDRET